MKQAFVEWVGDEPFSVSWQLLEAQCDLTHPLTRDRCSQVKWFSDKDSCLLSSGSIKSCWTEQAAHLHPLPLAASLQPEVRSSSLQRPPCPWPLLCPVYHPFEKGLIRMFLLFAPVPLLLTSAGLLSVLLVSGLRVALSQPFSTSLSITLAWWPNPVLIEAKMGDSSLLVTTTLRKTNTSICQRIWPSGGQVPIVPGTACLGVQLLGVNRTPAPQGEGQRHCSGTPAAGL